MRSVIKVAAFVLASLLALPVMAEEKLVTLLVPDMTCAACPTNVKRALVRVDGVKTVELRASAHEAVVKYDTSKASVEDLMDMVALAGYPATVKSAAR